MPYLNQCSFMGHVGRNAELKQSKDGATNWAEFSLGVGTGTKADPKTLWVKCRVFGKNAMRAIEKCNKGDTVYVSGRLDVSAYLKKQDGTAASDVSLNVSDWQWIKTSNKADATDLANAKPTDDFVLPF